MKIIGKLQFSFICLLSHVIDFIDQIIFSLDEFFFSLMGCLLKTIEVSLESLMIKLHLLDKSTTMAFMTPFFVA